MTMFYQAFGSNDKNGLTINYLQF